MRCPWKLAIIFGILSAALSLREIETCEIGNREATYSFIYRRPTLYPLEIAVDFLKSL